MMSGKFIHEHEDWQARFTVEETKLGRKMRATLKHTVHRDRGTIDRTLTYSLRHGTMAELTYEKKEEYLQVLTEHLARLWGVHRFFKSMIQNNLRDALARVIWG